MSNKNEKKNRNDVNLAKLNLVLSTTAYIYKLSIYFSLHRVIL